MVLPLIAAVAGGLFQASAANKAAKAQTQAADKSINLQREFFNTTRDDLSPFKETGVNALATLSDPNAFQADPGYQFRLQQGQDAINALAAKRGNLFSGATGQALTGYNQDLASQEYGNWFNRQFGLAQMGQNAAAQTGSFGANAANQISNGFSNIGNAQSAGAVGVGNAINNGIQNGLGVWQYQNMMNQLPNYGGGNALFGGNSWG